MTRLASLAFATVLAASSASAFGCALPPPMYPADMALSGTSWSVHRIGDLRVPEGAGVTLIFGADGTLTGSSGCNSFSAGYSQADGTVAIEPAVSTRMGCSAELAEIEQKLFETLPEVTGFYSDPRTGQLVFAAASGEIHTGRPPIEG